MLGVGHKTVYEINPRAQSFFFLFRDNVKVGLYDLTRQVYNLVLKLWNNCLSFFYRLKRELKQRFFVNGQKEEKKIGSQIVEYKQVLLWEKGTF